jgi:phosphate transport system permease protein
MADSTVFSGENSPEPMHQQRRWSSVGIASGGFTVFFLAAVVGMIGLFAWQSMPVWMHSGISYVTGVRWFYRQETFGALPMIYGTMAVAVIAMVVAVPLGVGGAVFTSEYLPRRPRLMVKMSIELLAGIPSVVYGLLGILVLRNYVYDGLNSLGLSPLSGDSLLTAGLLLAVMILPTVMTLCDDALRAVPASQREASRGLGLTHAEAVLYASIPQAWRGIVSAVSLALGRALGETIAVFLVVGRQDNQLPESPLSIYTVIQAGQTLTSKLGGAETNIAYGDPLHWAAMVGLGLLLLVIVGVISIVSGALQQRADAHAEGRAHA